MKNKIEIISLESKCESCRYLHSIPNHESPYSDYCSKRDMFLTDYFGQCQYYEDEEIIKNERTK